jgi:hypothetical protein
MSTLREHQQAAARARWDRLTLEQRRIVLAKAQQARRESAERKRKAKQQLEKSSQ